MHKKKRAYNKSSRPNYQNIAVDKYNDVFFIEAKSIAKTAICNTSIVIKQIQDLRNFS